MFPGRRQGASEELTRRAASPAKVRCCREDKQTDRHSPVPQVDRDPQLDLKCKCPNDHCSLLTIKPSPKYADESHSPGPAWLSE